MINIAIIGGGPAASTLAIQLCRKGWKMVMFATPVQVPILVGGRWITGSDEHYRAQGFRCRTGGGSYSVCKPGACFTFNGDEVFEYSFADNPDDLPEYSYNVPRIAFNATLLNAAQTAGGVIQSESEKSQLYLPG